MREPVPFDFGLAGGSVTWGNMAAVAVGAVFLSLVVNALIVSRFPPQFKNIIVDGILVCAGAVDQLRRQQLYKRR